jgi:hypothetical protein
MKNRIPKIILKWVSLIPEGNPKEQASLYSKNAVLLATFEPMLLGRNQIFGYMVDFLDKDNMSCQIMKNVTQIDEDKDTMIASGIYLFTFDDEDGDRQEVLARYTYVINEGRIINHHSSVMPEND